MSAVAVAAFIAAAAAAVCQNSVDCSLNGECVQGSCACEAAWKGPKCETLNTKPASLREGYDSPANGGRSSAWGGSVLYDNKTQLYHMYTAEMVNECGIEWWEPNSQVVHAVSHTPGGPYNFSDVVMTPFAHSANAVRGPKGEFVIYMTYRHPDGFQLANCTPPSTPPHPPQQGGKDCPTPPPRNTYMTWSPGPYGPWADPVLVVKANYSEWNNCPVLIDPCLATVIRPDGSAIGIWRKCTNTNSSGSSRCQADCCTYPHLLTASDWKDPATYNPHSDTPLFPELQPYGSEDPFLWFDEKVEGGIHAIFHDEQGATRSSANGTHAFSPDDGKTWYYGTELAYNNSVQLTNGSTILFARREQPHIVLDEKNVPVYINTGAQQADAPTNCSDRPDCYRSYVLAQPLKTSDDNNDTSH